MTFVRSIPGRLGLALILSLALGLAAGSARAAQLDMFIKIEGIDGESLVSTFDISGPGEAPAIGLLVPAVQKVRDSAARSRDLAVHACTGAHYPKVILTCRKAGVTARDEGVVVLTIELTDVVVTQWATRGGVSVAVGDVNGDGLPQHEVHMTYASAAWIWPETREPFVLDCSSGVCNCRP